MTSLAMTRLGPVRSGGSVRLRLAVRAGRSGWPSPVIPPPPPRQNPRSRSAVASWDLAECELSPQVAVARSWRGGGGRGGGGRRPAAVGRREVRPGRGGVAEAQLATAAPQEVPT